MASNEPLEQALEQSRELQQSIIDAFGEATHDIRPHIECSLRAARDLRATLTEHIEAQAGMVCENIIVAKSHVEDYLALGARALQESSEKLRAAARQMIRQAAKVVDAAADAANS